MCVGFEGLDGCPHQGRVFVGTVVLHVHGRCKDKVAACPGCTFWGPCNTLLFFSLACEPSVVGEGGGAARQATGLPCPTPLEGTDTQATFS